MKRFISWSTLLAVFIGSLLGWVHPGPAQASVMEQMLSPLPVLAAVNEADAKRAQFKGKVDINNSGVRSFLDMPGMYPTIARKIIANSPYQSFEEVYEIQGLTARQKEILAKYEDRLTVTEPSEALNYGGDRINNGIYR